MKTTKSYLAGLGMTGIVIASILSLLVIGTGLVAFDGQPGPRGSKGPLERVVVDDAALEPQGRAAKRQARRAAALVAATERFRAPSRALAVRATPRTAGGRPARRPAPARSPGRRHGGAEGARADVLGGGASTGQAPARNGRGRPDRRGRSSDGQPAPRRGDMSGGGAAVPPAVEHLRGKIPRPKARRRVMQESRERANGAPAVPPGLLP